MAPAAYPIVCVRFRSRVPSLLAAYRVVLYRSAEGYSVSCPSLPGCWSEGQIREDALANIRSAIAEYVEAMAELAQKLPGGQRP